MSWQPPPRKVKLVAAVPASYTSTEGDLRHKTIKVGLLGRLFAVYRVDEAIVYIDRPAYWRDAELMRKILEYMVTAPYLRKKIYPPNVPELRYASLLPPLQLPTHGVGGPVDGEVRQALVLRASGGRALVEAGLEEPVWVRGRFHRGQRILVRIVSVERGIVEPVEDELVYNGFKVTIVEGLSRLLSKYRNYTRIATSRKGRLVDAELLSQIGSRSSSGPGVLVLFGAPDLGLYELAELENLKLEDLVDYVVNTIPQQGTKTVRVEEAVAATLALLNLVLS
ncbi:putative RNA uridine N3 methyltransferase [Hyperthermus butylicus]|uniref:Conserved archaeal protein n=1 Tax=Hyperthermus butylicus (strain DSM 5456 / JCM 9403 / PLM1-5) TaxID=415426 RepID=A2BMC0_HYPBU|nr:putative RNA uridine N3 methyltransferase [Hyperthermus butylicus]ABM81131.1 conserved archaeal protein [Hyperthermus butylicus DSM 5456]